MKMSENLQFSNAFSHTFIKFASLGGPRQRIESLYALNFPTFWPNFHENSKKLHKDPQNCEIFVKNRSFSQNTWKYWLTIAIFHWVFWNLLGIPWLSPVCKCCKKFCKRNSIPSDVSKMWFFLFSSIFFPLLIFLLEFNSGSAF